MNRQLPKRLQREGHLPTEHDSTPTRAPTSWEWPGRGEQSFTFLVGQRSIVRQEIKSCGDERYPGYGKRDAEDCLRIREPAEARDHEADEAGPPDRQRAQVTQPPTGVGTSTTSAYSPRKCKAAACAKPVRASEVTTAACQHDRALRAKLAFRGSKHHQQIRRLRGRALATPGASTDRSTIAPV